MAAGRWSPASRALMSATMSRQWADPERRKQRLKALAKAREKSGRPPLSGVKYLGSKQISARIVTGDHDLLIRVARARDMDLSELLRDYIEDGLAKDVRFHHYKASTDV